MICVFLAATNPFCGILVLSKTSDQSSLVFGYVREFFKNSSLRTLIDEAEDRAGELRLLNESRIICRTCGLNNSDNLRGWSVGLLGRVGFVLWDESAFLSQRAIQTSSFAAVGGFGQIHVSTPFRKAGGYYRIWNSGKYKNFHFPAASVNSDGSLKIICPRLTKPYLEEKKATASIQEWTNDVLGEFCQGSDCVFDASDIELSIDPKLPLWPGPFKGDPNRSYVYSLDTSKKGHDRWVLLIGHLEKGTMIVDVQHAWIGTESELDHEGCDEQDDPDKIIRDICHYRDKLGFACQKFWIDSTNNDYFPHVLLTDYLFPIDEVNWSERIKERLVLHLQSVLKARRLKIPNHVRMRDELTEYAFDWEKMKDHSERKLFLALPHGDDYVSSLAMLVQSCTIRDFQPIEDRLCIL